MGMVRPRIALRVLGKEISAQAEVPAELGSFDQLLPLMLALDQAAIDVTIAHLPSETPISCAKGCSACCRRQPVPITPPEALAIGKYVDELPEPRRTAIRERFARHVQALTQAGLLSDLLRETAIESPQAARALVERYVALGLVCPFLEDDACSIHPARPFVCRQYLVTSSPSLCQDPLHLPVQIVPMPLRPAHAMLKVVERFLGMPGVSVPLVLALEFVERHRLELEQPVPMQEALSGWLHELTW